MTTRDDQDVRYWLTDKGWAVTQTPITGTTNTEENPAR